MIPCGSAWCAQYLGEKDVSVCFFGEGTTNIGAFHEALNFAAVWKLPVVKLNATRLRTAERLAENSRTTPHVFQAIEVDFTARDVVRQKRRDAFGKSHGFALTFQPFIARAACLAIQAHPQINARFSGDSLILSRDVNLGVAVDLPHNGLVVPVVCNAGDLTLDGLSGGAQAEFRRGRIFG